MSTLEQFGVVPVDFATLAAGLGGYKSPHDKISSLEEKGRLIRLKKGLFVVSPDVHKQTLSKKLIANHLYGPSYISFENALSFYKLIPERVYSIRSMTTKRGKTFSTPLGNFEYISAAADYFEIGIKQEIIDNKYAWLIASPEKALCDMIVSTAGLRLQSVKAMQEYLEEDLRIDIISVMNFDSGIIKQCIETGRKKTELIQLLKLLEV
jgi:predicted transcriptional regulator of viral defense system